MSIAINSFVVLKQNKKINLFHVDPVFKKIYSGFLQEFGHVEGVQKY